MQTLLWLRLRDLRRRSAPRLVLAQFAAIRTTMDLGGPSAKRSRSTASPRRMCCLIPAPASPPASRRNSRTPKALVEAEFAARVHEPLAEPGTCGVGYNSLRFDDEFTRNLLYRNFFDPYAREWENGNFCAGISIDLRIKTCYALRPHGIECGRAAHDGLPSFRLEDLAESQPIAAQRARARCAFRRRGPARLRARAAPAPAAPVGLAPGAPPQAARAGAARCRQHDAARARLVALSGEPRLPRDRRAACRASYAAEQRPSCSTSDSDPRAIDRARRRRDRRSRVHAPRGPSRSTSSAFR